MIFWGGGAACVFGMLIGAGWYAHISAMLPWTLSLMAMKFNTALCFVFCGAGLMLLQRRRYRLTWTLAGIVVVIAVATLLEYFTGRSFGIDELLIQDYLGPADLFLGRPAPQTAIRFALIGAALMLCATSATVAWRTGLAAVMACLVFVAASVDIVCHFLDMPLIWGPYATQAPDTTLGLLWLSMTLGVWTWKTSYRRHLDVVRWLPVAAPFALIVTVTLLAALSVVQLKTSYGPRKQAYETLSTAQDLLGDVADMLRGARGYVLTRQQASLQAYREGSQSVPQQLEVLDALTATDPELHALVAPLAAEFRVIRDYAQQLLSIRDAKGLEAAAAFESIGTGRAAVDRFRADLATLMHRIQLQLRVRDAHADDSFHNTTLILIIASILAALMLAHAQIKAGRELERRRLTEERLRDLSTFQAVMLDSVNYAIVSTNAHGTVTTFNARAAQWLGYAAADVIGTATPVLWHDRAEMAQRAGDLSLELGRAVPPGFESLVARTRAGRTDEHEWTMVRKNRSHFPGWLSSKALTDAGGSISGYLFVLEDITERKKQEARLRLGEERFRRAFDDAPIGMALIHPDGQMLQVNHSLCEMLGYREQELMRIDLQRITHPDDLAIDVDLARQVLAGERAGYQLEKRCLHKNGSVVDALLSVSLVRDRDQTPLYFVTQIEDISERLKVARLKSEFVATVSHELRTPLTSIRGSLGLLNGGALGALPAKVAAMIHIAHQNSERLMLIINDILDIEKIDSGKVELQPTMLGIEMFLREAIVMNTAYAGQYHVNVVLESATPDLEVYADPDRLMQVVTNLFSNAVKFSPGTTVLVRASPAGEMVRLEVEDAGIGISEEFQKHLFEKFSQADGSAKRHFGGTGLGLAISKALVEQMGGHIGFNSSLGEGTTFFVELPGSPVEAALAVA